MSKRIRFGDRFPLAVLLTLILSNFAFAQSEKKVAYAILVDNTGSMRMQFTQAMMFGNGIVRRVHRRGHISLFHFESQGNGRNSEAVVTQGVEWSQDESDLESYIESLVVTPGQTPLLDAVRTMGEKLNAKAASEKDTFTNKIIIMISDGEDRVSAVRQEQLIKELKESGIKVYAIGLTQELGGIVGKGLRGRAETFLRNITNETGGRVVFPKRNATDIESLLNELLAE